MSEQSQFSEPVKWVFLTAIGVLIREVLGRLRRAPRPDGRLTVEQVKAMISAHALALQDASYFDQRIRDAEILADERHGEVMALIKGISRRLDTRGHGGD